MPSTKLAALQKVLQSDFLNAVREVYEHVYDTVDTQVICQIKFCNEIIEHNYSNWTLLLCIHLENMSFEGKILDICLS